MNTTRIHRLSVSALCAIMMASVLCLPVARAQSMDDAERKQRDHELQEADRLAPVKRYATSTYQDDMASLTRRQVELRKALAFSAIRLDYATKRLEEAKKANDKATAAHWQSEITKWTEKNQDATLSLNQANAEYEALVGALQETLAQSHVSEIIFPGETLEVFVAEDDSFNGRYQVRRGGYILLPRLGRVAVAGRSVPEAEQTMKALLEETQLQVATVIVERIQDLGSSEQSDTARDTIYLAGAFSRPGYWVVPFGVNPTLLIAILRTGGVSENADLRHVRVLRLVDGKGLVEEVNVDAILNGRQLLTSDLELQNNDILVVPDTEREDFFYITGNIASPGIQEIPHGLIITCYAGILRAGGFARFANLRKVYVLRDVGSGQRVRIKVNVRLVKKGLMPDLILDDQDIVVVPEKFFSF